MWNPLMYALVFKHLNIVRYLIEECKVNAKLCLRDPAHSGEYSEVSPQYEVRSKCFAVLVAINNKDLKMLNFLLNNLHQLWSYHELEVILQELNSFQDQSEVNQYLDLILKSRTFESIFLNRCFKHQVELLSKIFRGDMFDVGDSQVQSIIDLQFSLNPFTTAYLVVLLKLRHFKADKIKSLLRKSPKEIVQNQRKLFLTLQGELQLTNQEGCDEIVQHMLKVLNSDCQYTLSEIYSIILKSTISGDIAKLQEYIFQCKFTEVNQITDEEDSIKHEVGDMENMFDIAEIVLKNWDTKGKSISLLKQSQKDLTPDSAKNSAKNYKYIHEWNPLLLAIYFNHMHIVRYFCEIVKVNLRSTLSMSKGGDHPLIYNLLLFLLKSKTTHSLFLSFSYHFRIQFLSQFVQNYFDETSTNDISNDSYSNLELSNQLLKISNIFKNEICEQPYSPISMIIFLYIHPDPRRFVTSYYNTNDIDIERFIRSNYDSAQNIVEGFKNETTIAKLKEEIAEFCQIKVQLSNLAVKIQNHPQYLFMTKSREVSRRQSGKHWMEWAI
eukprot:403334633